MPTSYQPSNPLSPDVLAYYESGREAGRLLAGHGKLEFVRTQELILRSAPPPPAVIYDVGGGSGVYAHWLAQLGYEVHLVDPVPLHIEQARLASQEQSAHPIASFTVGDAAKLNRSDGSVDVVLLLGPLYHLTEREDRLAALCEAHRVLRSGGAVLTVGISRFASTMDGLLQGFLNDPEFMRIVQRDLLDGQHRNPTGKAGYFTTAFFHHPDELKVEIAEAGFQLESIVAVEGLAWVLPDFEDWWRDETRRARLLDAIRWLEAEPSLLGACAHILAIGRK
jgi:ubiquinone/menaquinone biosynthesis C-methylase UbiE